MKGLSFINTRALAVICNNIIKTVVIQKFHGVYKYHSIFFPIIFRALDKREYLVIIRDNFC